MQEIFAEFGGLLFGGTWDTLLMVFISTFFAYVFGLPIGVIVTITQSDSIMPCRPVNMVLGWIVNIGRSIPFIILIVALMPFTRALVGSGTVVITVGGGGIPVVRREGKLAGVPAVIDKDFASAKLAELLDADLLVILTAVEKVAVNFGKPDQKGLDALTPAEAREYIAQGQFAPGSMLPKVQAALSFAESRPGRTALITLLEKAKAGIAGETGTSISM